MIFGRKVPNKKKSGKLAKFFSVEIFHMMSRLRIQNFMIIGHGVPELRGGTNTHTNYFSNIDTFLCFHRRDERAFDE